MNEEHYKKLENMYDSAPCNEFYQPIMRVTEGQAEVEITVERKYFHAANAMHGSVYFKLLDDTAFFAVNSLVEDVFVLTMSFNTYLLRPVSAGRIKAVAKVVNTTRNTFLAESVIYNEEGKEIARGTGNFVRSKMPLTEDIGYHL